MGSISLLRGLSLISFFLLLPALSFSDSPQPVTISSIPISQNPYMNYWCIDDAPPKDFFGDGGPNCYIVTAADGVSVPDGSIRVILLNNFYDGGYHNEFFLVGVPLGECPNVNLGFSTFPGETR